MPSRAAPWIILALLALVVGLPIALRPTSPPIEAGAETLIIYTPHNEQIRYEFARAFNEHRAKQNRTSVHFDWRTGGTSDIYKQITDQFANLDHAKNQDHGIGIDLFFGGGEYDHNKLAKAMLTIPANLPESLFEQAFPQSAIGGEPLNHSEQRWVGVALSSFGIVYNREYLDALNLEEPATWDDLTAPQYFRSIALADPAHSGSIAATYHVILRRKGWKQGWRLLRRVCANARYFTAGASQVPRDVSSGEAAAGMCIDFYGRFQAGAVGHNRVGYTDPAFMTATTADTISLLRGAPNEALAREFIHWLLTPQAQRLWQLKLGAIHGPEKYELRRQPIRSDLYTPTEKANWTDPQIEPFATSKPIAAGMPAFYNLVAPICHAIAIDIHDDLTQAWQTILDTDDPAKRAAMIEVFDAMPEALTVNWPQEIEANALEILVDPSHPHHQAAAATMKKFVNDLELRWEADPDQRDKDRLAWTLFFRQQYREVVAMKEKP